VRPLRLDTNTARVTMDGTPIQLTAKVPRILSYLMHHRTGRQSN
jgi:two-component system OmpR family response regulator